MTYAVTFLSTAEAVLRSISLPVNFLDKAVHAMELAEIIEEARDIAFTSAWRSGQLMDLDQVIILATEEPVIQAS